MARREDEPPASAHVLFPALRDGFRTAGFRATNPCTPATAVAVGRSLFRAPQECQNAADRQNAGGDRRAPPTRLLIDGGHLGLGRQIVLARIAAHDK